MHKELDNISFDTRLLLEMSRNFSERKEELDDHMKKMEEYIINPIKTIISEEFSNPNLEFFKMMKKLGLISNEEHDVLLGINNREKIEMREDLVDIAIRQLISKNLIVKNKE